MFQKVAIAGQTMDESITKNCSASSRNSSQVMYVIHFKIIDHWKLYQKKHYTRDDNQVDELREPEEECESSDKDDWLI